MKGDWILQHYLVGLIAILGPIKSPDWESAEFLNVQDVLVAHGRSGDYVAHFLRWGDRWQSFGASLSYGFTETDASREEGTWDRD